VWRTQYGNLLVGNSLISDARDLRLVSRPTPPEPPLRVGDWVRHEHDGTWQIVGERGLTNCHGLTRIEPPVGWPVGVPTEDGGTRWYVKHQENSTFYHRATGGHGISWADLLAVGGVPALAVTR
jgi:hypothetical protein